jgi:hypothetical protein
LTEDDGGREDLYELLLPISLGQGHARKMRNVIEVWAPWMDARETEELIDRINQTPDYLRKPKKRVLGEKMRLTDMEREALAIRTIAPIDVTDEQLQDRRKAKDNARKWRKRRAAMMTERDAWLATSLSRTQPWKRQNISRSTWERRRKAARQMTQVPDAGVSAIKLIKAADRLASRSGLRGRKRNPRRKVA